MNDTILLNAGMEILIERLGAVEAARFVYLTKSERFDYTEWHQTLSEGKTVQELYDAATDAWERNHGVDKIDPEETRNDHR